ncbi:hypothetical protein PIIN_03786 [Serendipita indica DSM 11827]|uniref:PNPLA domain-containing protein n=1 Tax=Serendipita indica (strain DSM 11827) TaxID=1109443 RepID=G4TET0_SERID|nr:hypothetical protein PIIN_03786 [Serendipita indica DSM 11827]
MQRNGNGRALCLASFDGGEARCMSQLHILCALMHQIQLEGHPEDPDAVVLPCEVFDLIGGSEAGGVIAIMLSRLRMSAPEAAAAFETISHQIYLQQTLPAKDRSHILRRSLESLLEQRSLDADAKLYDGSCPPAFVIVTPTSNLSSCMKFRTYRSRVGLPSQITILDAMLATAATLPYFDPVKVKQSLGEEEYIAPSLEFYNPIKEILTEAHGLYSGKAQVATLVSFGAGNPGVIKFNPGSEDWKLTLAKLLSNSERVGGEIGSQMGHLGIYFRFSVQQGIQISSLPEGRLSSLIGTHTAAYLEDYEVASRLEACVESIQQRVGVTTLDQLRRVGGGQATYKGIPALTTHFVMRSEPWKRMTDALQDDQSRQRIIVLSGMGGLGKTQLAIHFVEEHRSRFDYIFFVDGSSEASIQLDLIAHAKSWSPGCTHLTLEASLSAFCDPGHKNYLLFIDNVDDVNIDLARYLPQSNSGCIIITTRNRSLGHLASQPSSHVELEVMNVEEATEAIFRSSRLPTTNGNRQALVQIAEELGCLPVALIQAGSYIFQSHCTPEEYLDLLKQHLVDMLEQASADRQRRSVHAAFNISYQKLPHELQNFLLLLSCFHFANFPTAIIPSAAKAGFRTKVRCLQEQESDSELSIPLLQSIFCPKGGEWDDRTLHQYAIILQQYSLASFSPTTGTLMLRLHPLVHKWVSFRTSPIPMAAFRQGAVRLLSCGAAMESLRHHLAPHAEEIIRHTDIETIGADDSAAIAIILQAAGQGEQGREVWRRILSQLENIHGEKDLRVATVMMEIGGDFSGRLTEMETLVMKAIAIREELLGRENIDTLKAKGLLCGIYRYAGKVDQAREVQAEVSTILKALKSASQDDKFQVTKWFGSIHTFQGEWAAAERLEKETLEDLKSRLGETHPDTLQAMNNLAYLYYSRAWFKKAEDLWLRVVEVRKETLGKEHLETQRATANLGSVYHAEGRYKEAETLMLEARRVVGRMLGESHWLTLISLGNLGTIYRSQRRITEAEAMFAKVLDLARGAYPESDPIVMRALLALAKFYLSEDEGEKALPLLNTALAQLANEGTNNRLESGHSLYYIARELLSSGLLEEAKRCAMQAERLLLEPPSRADVTSGSDEFSREMPNKSSAKQLLENIEEELEVEGRMK